MIASIVPAAFIGILSVIPAFFTPLATQDVTSSIGQTIFNGIWKIVLSLFGQIANAFGSLFQDAFSGLGQSIVAMFQTFGFSLSPYGVWAPLMFVVGIGIAILVGYILFDIIDAEKDVSGFENDL